MHWMDVLLALTFLLVGGAEAYAIKNKVPGDTISERTRVYFKIKRENTSRAGLWAFLSLVGVFFAWFIVHIAKFAAELA